MLVVDHNTYSTYWSIGDPVKPMEYNGDVVITFDPSKTNMAMVVGTPDKTILNTIEFSGNNRRRGPVMDTTLYCQEVRSFLEVYLSKVKLYLVCVEQAILPTKKSSYHSNMVLTEIRSNILNFFLEHFNIKVVEINNWSWKFGVLPEGYRGKYEKGSKKWFLDVIPESPYAHYFEADMTDCICIYWYVVDKFCSNYLMFCNQYEPCNIEYTYYFTPDTNVYIADIREVKYNPKFSLQDNVGYYINRIVGQFKLSVPVESLRYEDIYGHSVGFSINDANCRDIKVVACRK